MCRFAFATPLAPGDIELPWRHPHNLLTGQPAQENAGAMLRLIVKVPHDAGQIRHLAGESGPVALY